MPTARSLMLPLSPLALPLASEQMLSHGDQESHGDFFIITAASPRELGAQIKLRRRACV